MHGTQELWVMGYYVSTFSWHQVFTFFAIWQKFSDATKKSHEKLSGTEWTKCPKSRKWSVAKYRPLEIVKLSCYENFYNKVLTQYSFLCQCIWKKLNINCYKYQESCTTHVDVIKQLMRIRPYTTYIPCVPSINEHSPAITYSIVL